MTNALILLAILAIVLFVVTYKRNDGSHIKSLIVAKNMGLNVLPILLMAFLVAGFIQLLLPAESIQAWLGDEAGWKGLFIGPAIGALVQGGPFTFFPLFDAIFKANIGTGTAIAMITGWGMLNIGHLPWEFAFLGPRFVMLKYTIYIAVPPVAGLIAHLLFS